MARPCSRLAAALVLTCLGGCAPEVLLASKWDGGGGAAAAGTGGGGMAGSAGTGGTAGDVPGGQGGGGDEPAPRPRLVADSVADFALTQGEHGWFYGYDEGTTAGFTLMTEISTITDFMPPDDVWRCWLSSTPHWTQLFELGGHPNGVDTSAPSNPVLQRAVRRWISTVEGTVRITGEIAKIDAVEETNGIEASVVVDGVVKLTKPIAGDDSAGVSYEVIAEVRVDSTLDFVLDPRESSDHHDLTRFTAIVEHVNTPSTE